MSLILRMSLARLCKYEKKRQREREREKFGLVLGARSRCKHIGDLVSGAHIQ
jgi:hypothetical protein